MLLLLSVLYLVPKMLRLGLFTQPAVRPARPKPCDEQPELSPRMEGSLRLDARGRLVEVSLGGGQ